MSLKIKALLREQSQDPISIYMVAFYMIIPAGSYNNSLMPKNEDALRIVQEYLAEGHYDLKLQKRLIIESFSLFTSSADRGDADGLIRCFMLGTISEIKRFVEDVSSGTIYWIDGERVDNDA
jgi:hypothetical protein